MHYSKENQRLPFRINNSLMCLSERKPKENQKELKEIKLMVRDKNYEFFSESYINVFNSEVFYKRTGSL